MTNAILSHHGIKGQKWGVRRYQNRDGSLTKYGVERLKEAGNAYENLNTSRGKNKITSAMVPGTNLLDKRFVFEKRHDVSYILDKYGNVKLTYLNSGHAAVAKGREWCQKHLKDYFHDPRLVKITYLDN
jgi:hypothetical protein